MRRRWSGPPRLGRVGDIECRKREEIKTRPFQLVTGRVWRAPRSAELAGARSAEDRRLVHGQEDHIDDLITHVMPVRKINDAFDLMHKGESIRSSSRSDRVNTNAYARTLKGNIMGGAISIFIRRDAASKPGFPNFSPRSRAWRFVARTVSLKGDVATTTSAAAPVLETGGRDLAQIAVTGRDNVSVHRTRRIQGRRLQRGDPNPCCTGAASTCTAASKTRTIPSSDSDCAHDSQGRASALCILSSSSVRFPPAQMGAVRARLRSFGLSRMIPVSRVMDADRHAHGEGKRRGRRRHPSQLHTRSLRGSRGIRPVVR